MAKSLIMMLILGAIVALITMSNLISCEVNEEQMKNINEYLENIYKNRTILKNFRPNFGGEPVNVLVTMYNIDISLVSQESMNFKFDFYLRQKWTDPRLAFDKTILGVDQINLNGAAIENSIWRPDTFIASAKRINEHNYQAFSDGNSFFRISENGTVFYSHRLTTKISCVNYIKFFPMDKPKCVVHLESYGFSAKEISYQWSTEVKHPIAHADKNSLIGFKLKNIEHRHESITLSTGTYSILLAQFNLERNCGYYWLVIYLPAIFLVILSWMPFCMDPEQKHYTRLAIGSFTSISIVIVMIGSIGLTLPHYHSLTAINVYLFVCMLMIFLAFIRSASTRCKNGCTKSYKVEQCQIIGGQSSSNRCARMFFPVLFILFNICYAFTLWFATK